MNLLKQACISLGKVSGLILGGIFGAVCVIGVALFFFGVILIGATAMGLAYQNPFVASVIVSILVIITILGKYLGRQVE